MTEPPTFQPEPTWAPPTGQPLPPPPQPQPQWHYPPVVPRKPKLRLTQKFMIGGAIVAIIGVALTVWGNAAKTSNSSKTYEVTYEVEGSAPSVNITMNTPTGTSQQQDVRVPITNRSGTEGLKVTMRSGSFAYISAQNTGSAGVLTCHILLNGVDVVDNTSSGAYAIVTCSGRV